MARGMNVIHLIGRVGKAPELKYTKSGKGFARWSIATDDSYKDKDGNLVEQTDWHNCVAWGKAAELVSEYVNKGDLLQVTGKVKYSKSEVDNVTRYYTDVVVQDFMFLQSKGTNGSATTAPSENPAVPVDDDFPF